ncbi:MAG: TolC family protein [Bacteroidales bacterium]
MKLNVKFLTLLVCVSFLFSCIGAISASAQIQRNSTKNMKNDEDIPHHLGKITIFQAIEIARINSPVLQSSFLNLEKYKQILIAERASMKSKFSLNLKPISYSKNRAFDQRLSQWYTNESYSSEGTFQMVQAIPWTNGTVSVIDNFKWKSNESNVGSNINSDKAYTNNIYLQLNQPLFTYNTRKMKLKELEYDLENANISYALKKLSTEQSITSQFYTVYMAQEQLEIAKTEYENSKKSYDIINAKVNSDLSAKEELFQAELNMTSAESSVASTEVSLENAKDNLKKTLGIDIKDDFTVISNIDTKKINVDLEKATEHGLASRLELRQREITTRNLEFEMIRTKALNEFKGEINMSVGITGDNPKFSNMYENPTTSPMIAISFSVPIFDWGEKRARIKAQEKSMEINTLDTKVERIDIQLNIRKTWRNLENDKRQINIAKKNIENAQFTYDLNLVKYREGDITGMQMTQFQTQLSSKKKSYTQSIIDYKLELLNMKILSLYDFENDKPIVPIIKSENTNEYEK